MDNRSVTVGRVFTAQAHFSFETSPDVGMNYVVALVARINREHGWGDRYQRGRRNWIDGSYTIEDVISTCFTTFNQVGKGFRIVLEAEKRITHELRDRFNMWACIFKNHLERDAHIDSVSVKVTFTQ